MKSSSFAAIVAIASVAAIGLGTPFVSHAQLGGMFGGSKSGASNSGGVDLGSQQDAMVRSYVAAGRDIVSANESFSQALGIKAQAINAAATSDSISAKDVEAQDKAISADAAAVAEALKSGAQLKDAEAKANYAKGLVFMVSGVKKYMEMTKDVQNFSSGLSSASPLQMGKLAAGAYVVKTFPTSVTNMTTVLKSAIEFGKSNGVEIPKDATSLL